MRRNAPNAGRANGGSALASTPANAPSRAMTNAARASRAAWPIDASEAKRQSFQPEWMATMPPETRS